MTFEKFADDRGLIGEQREFAQAAWDEATKVEREACAKVCDSKPINMDGKPSRRGPNGAGTWYEDSPVGYVVRAISKAIRERSNA